MKLISQYKGLRREIYILCFGRLVTAMGAMIWPMLTMILSQKMGMSAKHIAWVMALVGILSLPANLIGGKMADHLNKKMNIVYLDIVSVICYVVCAVIPLSGKSIVLMFIAATCQSMEHPSYNALTADITVTDDRERAYSLQYLCTNLGFVMSPTIAGFLLRDYLWLAFLISGAAIGCSVVLIFFMVKDITPVMDTSQKAVYQADREGEGLWTVLKENKMIVLYILAVSGYYATYQMYNYLLPLDLARLHGDNGAVIFGSITSVNCVVVVVFTPLFTRMFPWISETVKTLLGQVLLVAGFGIFLLFMGWIPVYYIAMIVLTWGEVFSMLAESPYLTKRMPASHRGRINGLSEVLRTGLTSVYQLLIGYIYGIGASFAAWMTVLAFGGVFVLLCVVLVVKDRKVYKNLYL
ncbi:MFS transporter [Lachnospiraceae bacterium WCA-9-b2]|uniref:MFS transporter n=1 Tax=Sporofaciens musculi TaxID=2681861 RepID=A0A7X3SH43_9FIRM|nr:MFS transporter [Sporofaciens musculi]MCI9421955.1 MFS transporter [Dorea sp.]MXP73978.1 MFS transporter [Sporofaciens musculi]